MKLSIFAVSALLLAQSGETNTLADYPSYNWILEGEAISTLKKVPQRICTYREGADTSAAYHTVRIPPETKCPLSMTVEN